MANRLKARVQPIDIDAEKSILGSILIEPELSIQVIELMNEEDFYDEKNKIIFRAIKAITFRDEKIDETILASELKNQAVIDVVSLDYIAELVDYVPSSANIDSYIDIVKDAAVKRSLISIACDIENKGYDGDISSANYIDYAEKKIFEISQRRKTKNFEDIKDVVSRVVEATEANKNLDSNITGLYTGFIELDNYTLGFHPQELIILAARPAMGKSAMAMNLALNVAKKNEGASVAIFTLEMSSDQLVSRMLSSESQINSKSIRSGKLNSTEWRLFNAAAENIKSLNIKFEDDSSVTISDIRAKCRRMKSEGGLDLVVIDYLQLIVGENNKASRQEEVANISRNLKQMARELNVCVIALAQLSRKVEEREDKKPIMADLRESGSIEQDADIIMFLYREEYYKKAESLDPLSKLIIAKNRHGNIGDIGLIFEGNYSRFKSAISDKEDEENDNW